jgi:hypothetical protein
MTGLQLAVAAGTCLGLALIIALWQLIPDRVDPADFAARTSPLRRRRTPDVSPETGSRRDRVGLWATRHLPPGVWRDTCSADLDILGIPVHSHYGRKVLAALSGLILGPAVTYAVSLWGKSFPDRGPGRGLPRRRAAAVPAPGPRNPRQGRPTPAPKWCTP